MTEKFWYERFHWKTNPFKIQPDPEHIVGFVDMRAKIISYIHSHDPFLIVGPTGAGKTTLLLWTATQKDARYVYHNFALKEEQNVLQKKVRGNLFQRLNKKPIVALLDEVQDMPEETARWLRASFDNGTLQSVVLASSTASLPNLQEPLISRIGSRIINLRKMDEKEAEQMVRQRVYSHGKHSPFDDEALKIILRQSEYQPRKILENCEILCIKAYEKNEDYISVHFVKQHLNMPITRESIKERVLSTTTTKSSISEAIGRRLSMSSPPSIPKKTTIRPRFVLPEKLVKPAPSKAKPSISLAKYEKPSITLSPDQMKILKALRLESLSTSDIATKISGNRAGVAKQLSRLSLNTDISMMRKKGIGKPLVEIKGNGRPVVYGLTEEGRKQIQV